MKSLTPEKFAQALRRHQRGRYIDTFADWIIGSAGDGDLAAAVVCGGTWDAVRDNVERVYLSRTKRRERRDYARAIAANVKAGKASHHNGVNRCRKTPWSPAA